MLRSVILTVTLLSMNGCASVAPGLLFSSYSGPVSVGSGKVKTPKTGRACAANYLSLIALGDNSIEAAKKDGKIKEVASVDFEYMNILAILYTRVCTVVRGR